MVNSVSGLDGKKGAVLRKGLVCKKHPCNKPSERVINPAAEASWVYNRLRKRLVVTTQSPRAPAGRPMARRLHDKTLSQAVINPAGRSRWVYKPDSSSYFRGVLYELPRGLYARF